MREGSCIDNSERDIPSCPNLGGATSPCSFFVKKKKPNVAIKTRIARIAVLRFMGAEGQPELIYLPMVQNAHRDASRDFPQICLAQGLTVTFVNCDVLRVELLPLAMANPK